MKKSRTKNYNGKLNNYKKLNVTRVSQSNATRRVRHTPKLDNFKLTALSDLRTRLISPNVAIKSATPNQVLRSTTRSSYTPTSSELNTSSLDRKNKFTEFKSVNFITREHVTCARRNIRKQVLHAFGKSGKSGQKKPKFNDQSSINCKKG